MRTGFHRLGIALACVPGSGILFHTYLIISNKPSGSSSSSIEVIANFAIGCVLIYGTTRLFGWVIERVLRGNKQ
jgi:hypothetical protein